MSKKKKTAPVETTTSEQMAPLSAATLRRRMVLVNETDLLRIREAFAAKQPTTVTVHPPEKRDLTDEQRARRKAYRQRPEVREKQKAYRAARATRIRAARFAVTAPEIQIAEPQP